MPRVADRTPPASLDAGRRGDPNHAASGTARDGGGDQRQRRRAEGGFAGALRILGEIDNGPVQKRVGLLIDGRQPVREGALILDGEGNEVGRITSGGHSPSVGRPIAMGYVAAALAEPGTTLTIEQRGKIFNGAVTPMPFVPHRYHRKTGATA